MTLPSDKDLSEHALALERKWKEEEDARAKKEEKSLKKSFTDFLARRTPPKFERERPATPTDRDGSKHGTKSQGMKIHGVDGFDKDGEIRAINLWPGDCVFGARRESVYMVEKGFRVSGDTVYLRTADGRVTEVDPDWGYLPARFVDYEHAAARYEPDSTRLAGDWVIDSTTKRKKFSVRMPEVLEDSRRGGRYVLTAKVLGKVMYLSDYWHSSCLYDHHLERTPAYQLIGVDDCQGRPMPWTTHIYRAVQFRSGELETLLGIWFVVGSPDKVIVADYYAECDAVAKGVQPFRASDHLLSAMWTPRRPL